MQKDYYKLIQNIKDIIEYNSSYDNDNWLYIIL